MISKFIFQTALISMIGTPYKWGGNNPVEGFDCSGFAQEALRMAGINFNGHVTSHDMYVHFMSTGKVGVIDVGSLVFYGTTEKVNHVGIIIDGQAMISARGGDSTTLSEQIAGKQNAFVAIRNYRYRKDFVAAIKPNGLPW